MIKGLLIDLDNTLLEIDVDRFIEEYSQVMARAFLPEDPERSMAIIMGASYALLTDVSARDSNQRRLMTDLAEGFGRSEEEVWTVLERQAVTALEALRPLASPLPWTRGLLAEIRRRNLRVAIATNPIYPRAVIEERVRWAGVNPADVDAVACLETCRSTKPHLAYFEEMATALDLPLDACLMVGDDPDQDVPDTPSALRVHLLAPKTDAGRSGPVRHGPIDALWQVWANDFAAIPA